MQGGSQQSSVLHGQRRAHYMALRCCILVSHFATRRAIHTLPTTSNISSACRCEHFLPFSAAAAAAAAAVQISNNCGMLHYTSGGQFKVPVVIRGPGGVGRQLGAEHSQRLESYFQSIPGVQLVAVSTVANAKALLKSVSEGAARELGCVY
jgi:hypothetical protein